MKFEDIEADQRVEWGSQSSALRLVREVPE